MHFEYFKLYFWYIYLCHILFLPAYIYGYAYNSQTILKAYTLIYIMQTNPAFYRIMGYLFQTHVHDIISMKLEI